MTPRPPPPKPSLPRLNTSPAIFSEERSARSISPKSETEKPQRSRKGFFRHRSSPASSERSRSSSSSRIGNACYNISSPVLVRTSLCLPDTGEIPGYASPVFDSSEVSPIAPPSWRDSCQYMSTYVPPEIAEENEDDDNFANYMSRFSFGERVSTGLSPPPSHARASPGRLRTSDKPLPSLPEEASLHAPSPLRNPPVAFTSEPPRSHFSISTTSTTLTSPTDSHFGFSETPSICDSHEDEELGDEYNSGDAFTYNPAIVGAERSGFSGYSLPEGDYASEQTLRKATPLSPLTQNASAFPCATTAFGLREDGSEMSALEELLNEMGYLGKVIAGK